MLFTVQGEGYEPIGNKVAYDIVTTERNDIATPFSGSGSVHIELLPDGFVPDKFVDVTLSSSIVLSEILIEMPGNKGFNKAELSVVEAGVEFPDKWTILRVI